MAAGKQILACCSKSSSASKLEAVSSARSVDVAGLLKATPGASEPLKLCHVKPAQCGVSVPSAGAGLIEIRAFQELVFLLSLQFPHHLLCSSWQEAESKEVRGEYFAGSDVL